MQTSSNIRRYLIPAFCFLGMAALFPSLGRAQVARIELHPLTSASPTNEQFLTARLAESAPALIAGELRIPRPGNDRLPAVVLLHGSGGIGNNVELWAREILSTGTAVFIVDSFTGRGVVNTQADQDQLSRLVGVVDAYRALELLTRHPRIDPERIAVMGFSRGGGAAHWTAIDRFRGLAGISPNGPRFAGHIALYPTCNRVFREEDALTDRPILIIHGTADDYVPMAACRARVERLRALGRDARLLEIPGAHHVFDNPALPPSVRIAAAQTTRGCPLIEEDTDGRLLNAQTRQPFTYASDPCVERGVTIGHSAEGLTTARAAVREFVAVVLRPN